MKVFQFIVSLLFIGNLAIANDLETIDFIEVSSEKEWKKAFEKAKADNKVVFVDVYTDWCGYCHKLDNEVYTNEQVISYFNENFINIKFDAETQWGYQKAQTYAVDGYPTLLFLTTNEDVYEEIGGFVPSPTLLAYAEEVQSSWAKLPILAAQYERGTISKGETLEYIDALERRDVEKANEVAATYLKGLNDADYLEIETLWLASRFENYLEAETYMYITAHKDLMVETHGQSEYEDYIKAVYNDNLLLAIKYGDETLLNRIVIELIPEFVPETEQAEAAYITKTLYYGQREDFDNYVIESNAYLNNHVLPEDKKNFMFSQAVEILNNYESKRLYEHAVDLLKQCRRMDKDNFEVASLLVYTYALLGDKKQANESLLLAEDLADSDEKSAIVADLKQVVSSI
ncbi:thioredoxin family protein [Roseivirga pacifica]|uniref:thioredoxin family protein n=1 Tax=Roseivirga pacifica TaxID=1267423 RepID=UPI00227B6C77|nr:thioredoxin fold domain-containing protein [Roseivirga pacifica]